MGPSFRAIAVASALACGCGLSVTGIAESTVQDGGVTPSGHGPDASNPGTTDDDDSTVDANVPIDAGTKDADAATPPDGCFAPELFAYEGDAARRTVANGIATLHMMGGQRTALSHTFVAQQAFTRTKVDLDFDFDWSGSWGGGGTDYVPFFQQFFGANDQATSHNDAVMAQNVLEAHIEPGSGTQGLGGMGVPKQKSQVHVLLETTWSSGAVGSFKVTTTPGTTWTLKLPTASLGATSTSLTLFIGGSASGNVPMVTVGLRSACVTFDP